MSTCCSAYSNVAGAYFDAAIARRDLENYRTRGPGQTTRLLRDMIVGAGAAHGTLLDVGSGIGGLSFELIERGMDHVTAVDASAAYLEAAAQEAIRRDRAGALEFVHGDLVEVGPRIPTAAIVTLDRVICCYPAFEPLLRESLGHAERAFAYAYPRDVWYVHAAMLVENGIRSVKGNPFRAFVHPVARMTQMIADAGFHLMARRRTWQWAADLWVR